MIDADLHPMERSALENGQVRGDEERPALTDTPLLAALVRAGTQHVYADTASVEELGSVLNSGSGGIAREIDGNTANQPLVRKVVERYLDSGDPAKWVSELRANGAGRSDPDLFPLLYTITCGRIGGDIVRRYAAGRPWEISLQLHMGLCGQPASAHRIGHLLRAMVPTALVKVPFTPDHPDCLLVARDLERDGIPVNLTSTFSARQAVVGAILCDVTRTNIFMGRLSQGLKADLLGEHVVLETQRALHRLRYEKGVKTQLIVASMREWETFLRVAGCDVFTSPCDVLADFLKRDEIEPDDVQSQLEVSLEAQVRVAAEVKQKLGHAGVERLSRVEPELIDFLWQLRMSREFLQLEDGDALHKRFDEAGFRDVFYAPQREEQKELNSAKLPALDGKLIGRIPIDTHYSLLANADFAQHQEAIDREIARRIPTAIQR